MAQKYFLYAFLFQFIITIEGAEGMNRNSSQISEKMALSDQTCHTRAWVPMTRPRSTSFGNDTTTTQPRSKLVDRLRKEPLENIKGEALFGTNFLIGSPHSKPNGLRSRIKELNLENNTILIKRRQKLIEKIQVAESTFQEISALFQDDIAIGVGLCGDYFIRLKYYEKIKDEDKYKPLIEARDNLLRLQSKFDRFQSKFRGAN